jgi:putative transposase
MSLRAYSEINLHITWHVKDNSPVLTDLVESHTHRFLRGQAVGAHGVFFHDVGGTDDHIHLVVSVSPALLVSEWIGKLKGGSSHFINHEIANRKILDWQPGYGVVSFGTKDLPWVLEYVRNQRRHHADGRTFERLERTEPPEEPPGQGPAPDEAR